MTGSRPSVAKTDKKVTTNGCAPNASSENAISNRVHLSSNLPASLQFIMLGMDDAMDRPLEVADDCYALIEVGQELALGAFEPLSVGAAHVETVCIEVVVQVITVNQESGR